MSQLRNAQMVVEFYRQLELLVKARTPLPQAVGGVIEGIPSKRFAKILSNVREALEKGNTLAEALALHPRVFDEAHRRLIENGERNGLLPAVLHDVALLAAQRQTLSLDVQEIAAYPALSMTMAFLIMLIMLRYYVPDLGRSFQELAETPLPFYSACVLQVAHLVTRFWWPIAAVAAGFVGFVVWAFTDTLPAQRLVWSLIKHVPLGRRIVDALDMAGICSVWSLLAKRGETLSTMLSVSAGMVSDPALSTLFGDWQRKCEAGKTIAECMDGSENRSFSLLGTVLRTTPGGDLPDELAGMGEHYASEAKRAAQRFKTSWQIFAFGVMAVTVGFCVISLFMPLIQLYYQMGSDTF